MPAAMVGAVILAAGESSRLRQPKPLLPFHGATLLERTLTTVRAAGLEPIVVVLGHEANHVRRAVVLHGVEVVVNERYRDGMSTSVVAGLRAMPPRVGAALMVPVDQPFLAVPVLDTIVRRRKETGKPIVVPVARGRRGTPVLLASSVWPEAESLRGDVGFRALFPRHKGDIAEVLIEDPRALMDIDTPDDYERALRMVEG